MIIAIDLGLTGAIATSVGGVIVEDIPTTKVGGKTTYDIPQIVEMFQALTDGGTSKPLVIMESVHAMPTGTVANFSMGYGLGLFTGIATALGADIKLISPVTWKKSLKVSKDKELSRSLAMELFPHLSGELKLKKHHNRAESLLLLHYCITKVLGDPCVV